MRFANWTATFWLGTSLFPRTVLGKENRVPRQGIVKLPPPVTEGTFSVEQAINQRRTVRKFGSQALDKKQLSQLLWAAQGITGKKGVKRAAPSAGALYPMDLYSVVGQNSVAQMEAGVYHYEPQGHSLSLVAKSDQRENAARAALSQMWIARAPVSIVIAAEFKRITVKYKKRGVIYAAIEAGHVGQNLFLQAEALGLKAGIVGAFHEEKLIEAMKIPSSHWPVLIMPIGYQA